MRGALLGTFLCALLAGGIPEDLEEARRLINAELRFKEAVEVLEGVLAEPRIRREDRVEAYRLLGIAYIARGATESAEAAFAELLALEPGFELDPLLSPKIHRVFDRVKARVARAPQIVEVTAARNGREVVFTGRLEDPDARLSRVDLYSRTDGGDFREIAMAREGERLRAEITAAEADRLRIEYFLVGRDREGAPVARVSDEKSPSVAVFEAAPPALVAPPVATVEVEQPPRWYEHWWVWAIAIGVIGAGTATAIVLSTSEPDPPTGTLDPIQLD
jgi:hypothetical protein